MTFSLARLAYRAGLRRSVRLAPIAITDALKKDLYRIALIPVKGWEGEIRTRLLPAYERALSSLTRDDESDDIAEIIRIAESLIAGRAVEVSASVDLWMMQALRWHESRWLRAVHAGTGLDIFPFINKAESLPRVRAYQHRITGLIKGLDDTARKDIEEAIWRGLTQQTPRREMGAEIAEKLGIARRRANLIAIDQAQKLNGELTAIRMEEAGLDKYEWRHSGKIRFRKEHKARDGKTFRHGEPQGDEPGFKPFCGCIRMPIIEPEEEDA